MLTCLNLSERSQGATAVIARAVACKEAREWRSAIPGFPEASIFSRWPGKLPSSLRAFPSAVPERTDEATPPWELFMPHSYIGPLPAAAEPRDGQYREGNSVIDMREPRLTSDCFWDVNNRWWAEQNRLIAQLLERMAPEGYDVSGLRQSLINSASSCRGSWHVVVQSC